MAEKDLYFIKSRDEFVYGVYLSRRVFRGDLITVTVAADAMRFNVTAARRFCSLLKLYGHNDLSIVPICDFDK